MNSNSASYPNNSSLLTPGEILTPSAGKYLNQSRITDKGGVRGQLSHIVDVMPTVLDACGLEPPEVLDGVAQDPLDGASLAPSFTDADAPDPRTTQYFEMLGSRSIIHPLRLALVLEFTVAEQALEALFKQLVSGEFFQ